MFWKEYSQLFQFLCGSGQILMSASRKGFCHPTAVHKETLKYSDKSQCMEAVGIVHVYHAVSIHAQIKHHHKFRAI